MECKGELFSTGNLNSFATVTRDVIAGFLDERSGWFVLSLHQVTAVSLVLG